jgi:arylsulfatase A-like enzyme
MSKNTRSLKKKPNILILMTDQQRTQQHFPEGWAEKYLPWTTYLKKTGVTFKNNMCSSTACSPSRSTVFSGTYPTINGVLKVNDTIEMSRTLPMGGSLITLGKVMTDAGYKMEYKGKWHLDQSISDFSFLRPSDLDRMMIEDDAMENHYDMPGWTSPDLGTAETNTTEEINPIYNDDSEDAEYNKDNTALNSIGAGNANNDDRIVNGKTLSDNQQCAVDFIKEYNPNEEAPFCLVVSLANPHDIWVYPNTPKSAGYDVDTIFDNDMFKNFEFKLPASYYKDLNEKGITAQTDFLDKFQTNPLDPRQRPLNRDEALNYVKFYAYLQTLTDDLTGDLIDALQNNNFAGNQLEQDTLIIRMSDHGEMAMAQGGLRQKENNVYKETLKVPMIFSNPNLPNLDIVKDDFVSLIDLMPTIAEISEADIPKKHVIQGSSYAKSIFGDESNDKKFNFFATDDGSMSQYTSIRAIIDNNYKYAVYYQASYSDSSNETAIINYNGEVKTASKTNDDEYPVQFELYDLNNDPEEINNLLAESADTSDYIDIWNNLHTLLTEQMNKTFTCPDDWDLTDPPTD